MATKEERKAIEAHLKAMAEANGGRITPDMVVADAKRRDSPLHGEFEWDKGKAAEAHWLYTARRLIASVQIEIRTERLNITVPAYVRDPAVDSNKQGYISTPLLRDDQDAAREAVVAEFKRAADLLRRARHLAVAMSMEVEVDRVIASVNDLRRVFEVGPHPMDDGHPSATH